MRFILFILFIVMPFVEIALLIKLGDLLGFWRTIGIVVVTAIIGAYVLQAQGMATMQRVSQSMRSGEPPIKPVIDGFFLAISGAFLLTPGVVTDAIGLLLLVPPVRHAIARWGFGRIVKSGKFSVHTYGATGGIGDPGAASSGRAPSPGPSSKRPPTRGGDGPVIDGEFEEVKKK
jgi:UPF0716 protein FxsA